MELKLELEPTRMPVAVSFAESAARSAGFEERGLSLLALSVEELFLALCDAMPGLEAELVFRDLRYAVSLAFRFPQPPPDLKVFNITARPDHESDQGLSSMGLFLASRACDQFSVQQLQGGSWEIRLLKERNYPEDAQQDETDDPATQNTWDIVDIPSPGLVKQLSTLIACRYQSAQFPEEFTPQGKLLDKLASNRYGVIAAQTDKGELVGGLIWRTTAKKVVECFGPYLNKPGDPLLLTDTLCERLFRLFGRSNHSGIVVYSPQALLPSSGFEPSGSIETRHGTIWAGYRMLDEEFGAVAYLSSDLMPFYNNFCNNMALARETREYHDSGEAGDGLTLLSARLDRASGAAYFTPLLVGRDAGQVIAEHLQLFDAEGYTTVCCMIDTGRPFDSLLTPHLLTNGFIPRILIPWGGTGDLIQLFRQSERL